MGQQCGTTDFYIYVFLPTLLIMIFLFSYCSLNSIFQCCLLHTYFYVAVCTSEKVLVSFQSLY